MNAAHLRHFQADMRLANLSPITITDRLELVERLAAYLVPVTLLLATPEHLAGFQRQFEHLAPASVDVYVRHVQAFYRWAIGRELLAVDPSLSMVRPKVPRGRPHPTSMVDLRTIFACTKGALRVAYALAAFAGLRRGEICRLHRRDLDLTGVYATARLDGKGGKERTVPLLGPIVEELLDYGLTRSGWVVTRDGRQYPVEQLSIDSHWHLRGIGVETTLHSMRHTFATTAYRTSHDLLLVKELLGHESVATTEIYAAPDMTAAHERLSGVATVARDMLGVQRKLHVVPG